MPGGGRVAVGRPGAVGPGGEGTAGGGGVAGGGVGADVGAGLASGGRRRLIKIKVAPKSAPANTMAAMPTISQAEAPEDVGSPEGVGAGAAVSVALVSGAGATGAGVVGAAVGVAVGDAVGMGDAVQVAVGDAVGPGDAVGVAVGDAVGPGDAVGVAVGVAVGAEATVGLTVAVLVGVTVSAGDIVTVAVGITVVVTATVAVAVAIIVMLPICTCGPRIVMPGVTVVWTAKAETEPGTARPRVTPSSAARITAQPAARLRQNRRLRTSGCTRERFTCSSCDVIQKAQRMREPILLRCQILVYGRPGLRMPSLRQYSHCCTRSPRNQPRAPSKAEPTHMPGCKAVKRPTKAR